MIKVNFNRCSFAVPERRLWPVQCNKSMRSVAPRQVAEKKPIIGGGVERITEEHRYYRRIGQRELPYGPASTRTNCRAACFWHTQRTGQIRFCRRRVPPKLSADWPGHADCHLTCWNRTGSWNYPAAFSHPREPLVAYPGNRTTARYATD